MSNGSGEYCPEGIDNCSVSQGETDTVTASWRPFAAHVLFMTLMSITALVGLPLNGLVLGLIANRKRLQTICNLYILNRAIADIFLQVPNPFVVFAVTKSNFPFGYAVCVLYSAVLQISVLLGSATLVCITIDFYVGARPGRHLPEYRGKLRRSIFTVLWFGAAFLGTAIPFFDPFLRYREGKSIRTYCFPAPFFYSIYDAGLYLGVVCGLIAGLVPVILVWVFICLVLFPRSPNELTNGGEGERNLRRRPPTFDRRFVIALALVFTPCQLVFWPVQTFFTHYPVIYVPYAYEIVIVLLHVNAAVNPILCLIFCKDVQGEFLKLLPNCCRKRESVHEVQFSEAVSA